MSLGKALRFALLILPLFATSMATAAGLYKWTDSQGNVHYSQTPPPTGEFSTLKGPRPAPSAPETADEQLDKARDTLTPPPPPTGEIEEEKRQAELDKQNCEAGRKNLDIYTRYRRILNDKGEMVVLSDDERKAKIKESEEIIKKHCK